MVESEGPELIGVTRAEVTETMVRGGAGSRGKAIAALIVATVLGFLALQAFGGQADDSADPVEDPSEVSGEEVDPDSVDSPAVTTPPTTRPKRTTTTRPEIVIAGEPLFDYETGWDLILGNDGMKLTRLSMDSGSYQEFDRGYFPVAVVGDTLLVANNGSQHLRYARLSDLNARPKPLAGTMNPGFYGSFGLPDSGVENQAWLPGGSYEKEVWQLWDFEGEPRVVRETASVPNNFGPVWMHPTITGSPSGGVFEGEPGDLEQVADGRLLAVSNRHVVVEQCANPFDCKFLWLDRQSWQVDTSVVAPTIDNSAYLWGMRASADGRRLFVPDWQTGRGLIWNLQTGETESDAFVETGTFSPDSRYVAGSLRSGNLGVLDLETGVLAEWNVPGHQFYGAVLFVPASATDLVQ